MVREVKDPGIELPEIHRQLPASPINGLLSKMDERAKKARLSAGIKKSMPFACTLEERRAVEEWAIESGKKLGPLIRDLIGRALECRSVGLSPLAILRTAYERARHGK